MIKLYNTLTRKTESFKSIKKNKVGMYTCGPTVYNFAHIGNLRTMILYDLLKRVLTFEGYDVNHVMNITDVDDKTIKGSQKEKISLIEFTKKYENYFINDIASLNIGLPTHITRATEYIAEMVKMIEVLIDKGFAYRSDDGIYFSIDKDKKYGKLSQLEKTKQKKERIRSDEYDKENAQDFALWKFYVPEDGDVFWETTIGKGRPGWHIECSAMATRILGPTIDIHSGAIDLIFPHHTNEIAQSESATGKKFVNYWVHGAFLSMKEKMSKSLGNVIYLNDLVKNGYSPLHFRFYCLLTHYRKPLLFSYDTLDSAKSAYERLRRKIIELKNSGHKGPDKTKEYMLEFKKAIEDDLNMPNAIQVLWKVMDDFDFESKKKLELLLSIDSVLGLGISDMKEVTIAIPDEVLDLANKREKLRKEKKWAESDILRNLIKEKGFVIVDTPQGPKIEKI